MRRVSLPDYSKPIKARHAGPCGPYYVDLCDMPGTPGGDWAPSDTSRSGGFGGYLSELGDEIAEGCMARLRVKRADEIVTLRHTGWFCDDSQDATMFGVVARLPGGRGFLAGWSMGGGMATSFERRIYRDEDDAARAADEEARIAAEGERDHQEAEARRRWKVQRFERSTWLDCQLDDDDSPVLHYEEGVALMAMGDRINLDRRLGLLLPTDCYQVVETEADDEE